VKQAGKALDKGFAEVKTPSQAADVLDRIENAAGNMEEQDLAPGRDSADPIKQAAAINDAAATAPPKERAAVVLTEAAAQIAASPLESRATLDEAVEYASGESPLTATEEPPQVRRGRALPRNELIQCGGLCGSHVAPDVLSAWRAALFPHCPSRCILTRLSGRTLSWRRP
jgi:hypothetical protein